MYRLLKVFREILNDDMKGKHLYSGDVYYSVGNMSTQVELLDKILEVLRSIDERLARIEEVLSVSVEQRARPVVLESALGQPITPVKDLPESALGQPITSVQLVERRVSAKPELTPSEREVLEYIKRHGEATALDIAREFHISRSLATRYLRQLERLGYVVKEKVSHERGAIAVYKLAKSGGYE